MVSTKRYFPNIFSISMGWIKCYVRSTQYFFKVVVLKNSVAVVHSRFRLAKLLNMICMYVIELCFFDFVLSDYWVLCMF